MFCLHITPVLSFPIFFFFNDTSTTEIYTLFPTRRSSDLIDERLVRHGRDRYLIYCVVCHDPLGTGYGKIVDRKSTRLNSSHLGISYAVFCLKKKKNNEK